MTDFLYASDGYDTVYFLLLSFVLLVELFSAWLRGWVFFQFPGHGSSTVFCSMAFLVFVGFSVSLSFRLWLVYGF